MLISLTQWLQDIFRDDVVVKVGVDINDIRVRSKAVTFRAHRDDGSDFEFTVPESETWVVYSASLENGSRPTDPRVRTMIQDYPPISNDNSWHIWPSITVKPATDRAGGIVEAAYFPQVLSSRTYMRVEDQAWTAVPGDTIQFTMLYSRLIKGVDY